MLARHHRRNNVCQVARSREEPWAFPMSRTGSQEQQVTTLRLFSRVLCQEVTMTYRDPYNEPVRNPDDPWKREWGTGSMVAGIAAIVIMAGIIAYGANRTSTQPSTTGQGGVAPAPSRMAR